MYEWDFTVQEMIDCIEEQGKNDWRTCSLESVARQVGYSKYYPVFGHPQYDYYRDSGEEESP